MMKAQRWVVRCADYNGHSDVLFMMKSDDERFGTDNYAPVAAGQYHHKSRTLRADGKTYRVYPDWSLKEVDPADAKRKPDATPYRRAVLDASDDDLTAVVLELRDALLGCSPDADHDALVSVAALLGLDPDEEVSS
jgi:hypothetical protein